jgi:hypothetical protein
MDGSGQEKTSVLKILLIGCGGVLVVGGITLVALFVWLASGPEGGVRLANELEPYAVEYMSQKGLLEPGEEVLAYYDATITLDGTEAAILTPTRLVYHNKGNDVTMALAEISEIRHRYEALTGDIIEIEESSGKVMKLEIAPLNQGETFLNVLQSARDNAQKR